MIISSLLDTDLYKYTMMQLVYHHFPTVKVSYNFKLRTQHIDLHSFAAEIESEIQQYCQLRLAEDELAYLAGLPFIKSDFIDYLRDFQPQMNHVHVGKEDEFNLSITGPWLETILFEVPLLAILSEVYHRNMHQPPHYAEGRQRLQQKIELIQAYPNNEQFKFTDFGTRRRFGFNWHKEVVETFNQQIPQQFIGTSNVLFAKQLGIPAVGTMAHEYIQAFQALVPTIETSQRQAFEVWLAEYHDQLGIALSDTINLAQFLKDFDASLASAYHGARQDSGDPFSWADQVIAHYQQLGIDPSQKTLVFSDSLTMAKALAIYDYVYPRSQPLFGIGTHLTNDLGYKPFDMVIKMVECNGQPVAKLSDSPGKSICTDANYLEKIEKLFAVE